MSAVPMDSKDSSVYAITGLYSQAPPSEDSEVTESTCGSSHELVRASEVAPPALPRRGSAESVSRNGAGLCGIVQRRLSVETIVPDDVCGTPWFRPNSLQGCANIKMFVFLCCFLVTLQQALSSGYLNSVITTIEKRYDIPSGLSGTIASMYEIGNLITIVFVSYLGSKRHIPKWLAIGVVVMGIGSLIFMLPHFVTQKYTIQGQIIQNQTVDNICKAPHVTNRHSSSNFLSSGIVDDDTDTPCIDGGASNTVAVIIFMLAQLLIGCGGSPIFTLGTTYIDDHVKRESSALYIGCMYSMVAVGPVCGFLLGGVLLSYYVDHLSYDTTTLNISPNDPRWVGAWWIGFLIVGILMLFVSIPFFMFPRSLRKEREKLLMLAQEAKAMVADASPEKTAGDKMDTEYGNSIKDIPRSMWKLLSNPVYMVTCLGSCMELVIVSGFVVFLPKYLETQFSINKSQANIFTGGIAIPGACVGIIMGGYILKKLQLSPKGAVQFVLVFNIICLMLFSSLFFLGCDNIRVAGATMPYFNSSSTRPEAFKVNLTSMCNMGCDCSPNDIQPICGGNGLTYFSPCYAGCTATSQRGPQPQNYSNCACIVGNSSVDGFHEVTAVPVATSGPCAQICQTIIPFMVLLFIMSLTVSITQMPLLMIVLRSVSEEERSFALGMEFVIFRIFGYIPSPIMFGNVIDSTCLVWKAHCGKEGGFCMMYDIEQFRYKYVGICAGIKVLALSLFLLDWVLIRQMYPNTPISTVVTQHHLLVPADKVDLEIGDGGGGGGPDMMSSSGPAALDDVRNSEDVRIEPTSPTESQL